MKATPYRGFRFPKAIIQYAVWLYLRFTLSLRDVEELLAERGIVVTYETGPHLGRPFWAADRKMLAPPPWSIQWNVASRRDVRENRGRQMYLWWAVDSEGEVLDMLVQGRRDKRAALRLMRKLLKRQQMAPAELVTDRLRAYGAAARGDCQEFRVRAMTMGRKEPSHGTTHG